MGQQHTNNRKMAAIAAPAVLGLAGSSLMGERVQQRTAVRATKVNTTVVAFKVKKGINKAAKGGAPNTGLSGEMNKKGWKDAQGREGKGYGVYRFDKKYGANVDGYSPIYPPTSGPTLARHTPL